MAAQMLQVGNAVPFLLCWAILGAVYEAAYGLPSPKPGFLAACQAAAAAAKQARAAEGARPHTAHELACAAARDQAAHAHPLSRGADGGTPDGMPAPERQLQQQQVAMHLGGQQAAKARGTRKRAARSRQKMQEEIALLAGQPKQESGGDQTGMGEDGEASLWEEVVRVMGICHISSGEPCGLPKGMRSLTALALDKDMGAPAPLLQAQVCKEISLQHVLYLATHLQASLRVKYRIEPETQGHTKMVHPPVSLIMRGQASRQLFYLCISCCRSAASSGAAL